MKRYDYYLSRQLVKFTSIIFWTQVIIEVLGIVERKPEYTFIVPLCGVLWVTSIVYDITLVILNARGKKDK